MKILGFVLRTYSYLYHLILSLFLFGLAMLTLAGGQHNLHLGMLPWSGIELTHWVLVLGISGLLATALAVTGIFRFVFPLWCLVVVILMIRGFFLSTFTYSGPDQFRSVVWLVIGAAVAFLASLTLLKPKRA